MQAIPVPFSWGEKKRSKGAFGGNKKGRLRGRLRGAGKAYKKGAWSGREARQPRKTHSGSETNNARMIDTTEEVDGG